jgi:hypothetical protein
MNARHEKLEGSKLDQEIVSAPTRGHMEARLAQLKTQLLTPILETVNGTPVVKELYCAANEAAALAWLTVCPVLFFPALLEEKVRTTLKRWERQVAIYYPKTAAQASH